MIEELKNLIKNLIREDAEKNAQSPGKNENNIENIAQSIIDAIRKNVKTDNIMATINDFFSSNSEKGGSTTFNSIVNDATQSIVKQIDVAEDAAKGFIERLLQKLSLYIKSIIEDPGPIPFSDSRFFHHHMCPVGYNSLIASPVTSVSSVVSPVQF